MLVGIIFVVIILLAFLSVYYLIAYLRDIEETNKKIEWAEKRHYTLLRIQVPKNNTKSPLAAEQMFASLHGIYRKSEVLQEHFSFEIAATSQSINFYALVPTHLRDFIEGQIYSQYPTVEIEATADYSNISLENKALAGANIVLTKNDYFPIRTFTNFDVDPLAGITGVLSKIEDGEVLAVQAVMSPIDDNWQKEGLAYVKSTKEGKSIAPPPPLRKQFSKTSKGLLSELGQGIINGFLGRTPEAKKEEKKEVKLSGPEEAALKGIESKVTKLGYAVAIRVMAATTNPDLAETRVQSVVGSFKQFNVTNMNGFEVGDIQTDEAFLREFRSRHLGDKAFRLNVEEIASVFHFPDSSVETPNIVWAGSKKGEPPQNIPIEGEVPAEELTTFGLTSFRNRRTKFGIKAKDRLLHFYAIGKTGTGKSTLIENMIYDDIKEGRGVAVVDPHGELIEHILNFIPEERIKDVVYFNPDDREYPLAFNLLESVDDNMRGIVASGLMSIFTKLWAGVWSARMEYILRNAILAALEVPNATLLSIMRILNDPIYRKYALSCVSDPVVKDFFYNEYDRYDAKFRQEAIVPIQNKVGQFLSSTTIRNVVGQPKSTFDLSTVMDTGKIFLVNLSIGRIGEDNSKLLGSMMITKMQLAAMGRARIAEADRRDFFLYVDEFQNFATDSFATILSEARKYHLGLVLVNQYTAQIPELVADAIFGNVGTMISFRVGPDDAQRLVTQYQPVFDVNDLINLPNRQIYVKMAIDGVTSQAFSAHTLPPKGIVTDNAQRIIEASRKAYSRSRSAVEQEINDSTLTDYRPTSDKVYDEIRDMRPLILDGTMYKEFSAKGGERWYFGQPPEVLEEELLKIQAEESGEVLSEKENTLTVSEEKLPIPAEPAEEAIIPYTPADLPSPVTPLPSLGEGDEEIPSKKKRKRKRKKKSMTMEVYQGPPSEDPKRPNFAIPPVIPVVTVGDSSEESEASYADAGNAPTPSIDQEPVSAVREPHETIAPLPEEGRGVDQEEGDTSHGVPVAVNRGHQLDDWLPLEEIKE